MSINKALHLNTPETPSCLHGSQGLHEAQSHLLGEGFKMSSDRVCMATNALMVFLSREDHYFVTRKAYFWATRP